MVGLLRLRFRQLHNPEPGVARAQALTGVERDQRDVGLGKRPHGLRPVHDLVIVNRETDVTWGDQGSVP
jgi:hypothetical protein